MSDKPSDTPRTDIYVLNPLPEVVSAQFARELERENTALSRQRYRLAAALQECELFIRMLGLDSEPASKVAANARSLIEEVKGGQP